MRGLLVAAALGAAALVTAAEADACRMYSPLDMDVIAHADLVVVGRLSHYENVADQAARERRRRQALSPSIPADLRETLQDPATGYMSDFARFRITVRETLRGRAPRTLIVTWNNSTFGEPSSLPTGDYLVALSVSDEAPYPGGTNVTVLQAPCSAPFLFEADSAEALAARQRLAE